MIRYQHNDNTEVYLRDCLNGTIEVQLYQNKIIKVDTLLPINYDIIYLVFCEIKDYLNIQYSDSWLEYIANWLLIEGVEDKYIDPLKIKAYKGIY